MSWPDRAGLLPQRRPLTTRLVLFAAGCALTLAFAPFGLWYIVPLGLAPLLLVVLYATPRDAALGAFCFGAGLFLCGTYWLYISIHVFGRAPLLLAIALMVALVLIMAAWYALFGWLVARLVHRDPWRLVLLAPAAWLLIEWLRGWVLSGFPWLSLGYSQVDSPLAGWLPLGGVYGVSLLLVFSSAAAIAVLYPRRRPLAVLLAVLPWLLGALLRPLSYTSPAGDALTATLISPGTHIVALAGMNGSTAMLIISIVALFVIRVIDSR